MAAGTVDRQRRGSVGRVKCVELGTAVKRAGATAGTRAWDNDGANWHQRIGREMVTCSEAFPCWQSVTIALGQSTEDAMSGATPMITVYVNDDQHHPPVTVGFDLPPWRAGQLAKMLMAEAALPR